jgi:hypothetical protein
MPLVQFNVNGWLAKNAPLNPPLAELESMWHGEPNRAHKQS